MGHLLNSGKVGNTNLDHMRQVRTNTIAKWEGLGFLDGLKGHVRENIAQLYENQASTMLNENAEASGSGAFETVVFPIVRRVFSKLLANDIVSVQALNMPIGKLFYFVPKVSNSHIDGGANNSLTAGTASYSDKSLYDEYYDNSLFDRSKGASAAGGSTHTPTGNSGAKLVTANGVANGGFEFSLSGFSTTKQGQLIGPDGNEMDSEEFLSSLSLGAGVKFTKELVPYGSQIGGKTGGAVKVVVDLTTPAGLPANATTSGGYSATTSAATYAVSWNQYSSLEMETSMAEVTFEMKDVTVSVTERKLRASWSPELAQDVSAFHNIDAEAELTALLSEQVAAEIDREILRDLRNGAAWSARWNYDGWQTAAAGSAAYSYTQKDWNQTLITKINQVSAQIHKSTLRGGANFVVVSSEVSAVFDDLEYFHVSNADPEQDQYNMGIEKIGSLGGRYQVYRDPYAPANTILIGHKGKSMLDTGYVYAPYVPLQLTPTMYNPFTFAPVKGIMTRYAKKMVNARFYGRIICDNVFSFGTGLLK